VSPIDYSRPRVFHVLKHELRRRIIEILSDSPASYTQLLRFLDVDSGMLAYHLRNMEELLEKDGRGRYTLSGMGEAAVDLLKEGLAMEPSRPTLDMGRLSKTIFIGVLVLSFAANAYLFSNLIGAEASQMRSEQETRFEAYLMVEDSLDIVYSIFEGVDIDRGRLTELLMMTLQVKAKLVELGAMTSGYGYAYEDDLESMARFVTEFAEVLKEDDSSYLGQTLEKRYLIRELHRTLLNLRVLIWEG